MNWFPLPLFPEGSLASSVVTTVWVGVFVMTVMNLRFGWVFSGLVVPGYLVPLLIVKPWSAGVVITEAVLTYLTVYAGSCLIRKFGLGSTLFGRDRFSAMILVSTLYRVLFDAWLLPALGGYAQGTLGMEIDFQNNLHSFGLVVCCLAANQFWKTGLRRGAMPFAFVIGATFLIVRFVLMEYTNFNISSLGFLYEDIASSIHAAPKAYIVLVTTSLLGSRMNVKYGWDFNGIMIPAMIALQWYAPMKVLTSMVEALVILGAAMLVLRLPLLRSITMEGARKVMLFFTISFAYKLALGFGLQHFAPALKVSDYYGFGYLLPTLIAIKMHSLEKIAHQLRITLQISLVAMIWASAIGYGLTLMPEPMRFRETARPAQAPPPSRPLEGSFEALVRHEFLESHGGMPKENDRSRMEVMYDFDRGLQTLAAWLGRDAGASDARFEQARAYFGGAGYALDRIGDRYLRLAAAPSAGRPFFFFNLAAENELVVECPQAMSERGTVEAGLILFQDHRARVLAVSGTASVSPGSAREYRRKSWLQAFHRTFAVDGVVQVRRGAAHRLHVKRRLPRSLALQTLEARWSGIAFHWEAPREENPLRRSSPAGFCEFFISGHALDALGTPVRVTELNEPVNAWLLRERGPSAGEHTNLYRPPTATELLHLDRQVLEPLFALRHAELPGCLASIHHQARLHGYSLQALRDGETWYAVLQETDPAGRYWGLVAVRIEPDPGPGRDGDRDPRPVWCFEVPSCLSDASLRSFAITQFKRQNARALILAATHANTNSDGGSAFSQIQNRDSLLNLAHQVFSRSVAGDARAIVVQCRTFVPQPGEVFPEGDLLLATYNENRSRAELEEIYAPLVNRLAGQGLDVGYVRESGETSPYAVGTNPQARYMNFTRHGAFAMAWLSPFYRQGFRHMDESDPPCKTLRALGLELHLAPLRKVIEDRAFAPPLEHEAMLKDGLADFVRHGGIAGLREILAGFPGLRFEAVLDTDSRQVYLICLQEADGRIGLIANLSKRLLDPDRSFAPGELETWIDARAAWLNAGEPR